MLSYMLPVEEKPSSPRNLNLNLNLNGNAGGATNGNHSESDTSTATNISTPKLINFEPRASVLKNSTSEFRTNSPNNLQSHLINNLDNSNTPSILSTTSKAADDSKKITMTKIGNTKTVTLKR